MKDIKTLKVIGRMSSKGKEYYQTVVNENDDDLKFVPVFLKSGLTKLNFESKEKKVDSRGQVYTCYEINQKHCFMVMDENGTDNMVRVIIMK